MKSLPLLVLDEGGVVAGSRPHGLHAPVSADLDRRSGAGRREAPGAVKARLHVPFHGQAIDVPARPVAAVAKRLVDRSARQVEIGDRLVFAGLLEERVADDLLTVVPTRRVRRYRLERVWVDDRARERGCRQNSDAITGMTARARLRIRVPPGFEAGLATRDRPAAAEMSPVSTIRARAWGIFQPCASSAPRFVDANASMRLDTRPSCVRRRRVRCSFRLQERSASLRRVRPSANGAGCTPSGGFRRIDWTIPRGTVPDPRITFPWRAGPLEDPVAEEAFATPCLSAAAQLRDPGCLYGDHRRSGALGRCDALSVVDAPC